MLPKTVQGRDTQVHFPTTIEAFLEEGEAFLTRAFHAAGSLPLDDEVTAIAHAQEFVGGGMGRKLLLDIDYRHGDGLKRQLFVKFPLDYGHPLREAFTRPMDAEVKFSLLSMRTPLPVTIPSVYFADFDPASLSGILISERVAFGQGGIEPVLDKCQDFQLSDPLSYYRAMTTAMAKLAGAHRSGALGSEVDTKFPKPASNSAPENFPYSREDMAPKLQKLRDYAVRAPHLLPKNFASTAFLDKFCDEVSLVLDHQAEIYALLNNAPDFIALCHWNANLDNAWFWRDRADEVGVGLLDWGSVGQLNLARAFWGMTCAAELDFLDTHRRDLMANFVDRYHEAGGPKISVDDFETMYRLTISVVGLHWMIDAPTIIEANLPNFAEMAGRHDDRLQTCFLARAQQHILTVMLNEWSFSDIGRTVPLALANNSRFT